MPMNTIPPGETQQRINPSLYSAIYGLIISTLKVRPATFVLARAKPTGPTETMGRFKEFLRILQNKNPKPATPGGTPGLTPNVSRPTSATGMPPNSTVIVPLYMYPLDESTWEPLHKA
jgi:hypothetical protein